MRNQLLMAALLFTGITATAQNILRVNNTPGVNAPYTTLAAAITAAGVNDIIMLEGSSVSYGSVTIAKKVTIVGPGYLLNENLGLQATSLPATIRTMTLNAGAEGTSVSGVTFDVTAGGSGGNCLTINGVGNVAITNCYWVNSSIVLTGTANNLAFIGNYLTAVFAAAATYTGTIFTNNYIGIFENTAASPFTVTNNVIERNNSAVTGNEFRNCDVRNNIFVSNAPIFNGTGSLFKNNVFVATALHASVIADGTNMLGAVLANIFLGSAGNTTDTRWKLKVGSPAIGFGESGVDCGMYGGGTPYRPSGIKVGQPTITNFSSPASIQQNILLNVKVSAKVN
jgi:hypothetical protein